jgi:hypothetical protein
MSTTKETPQASCSFSGRYRPVGALRGMLEFLCDSP